MKYGMAYAELVRGIRAGRALAAESGEYKQITHLQQQAAKAIRNLIDDDPTDDVAFDAILFEIIQLAADDPNLYELLLAYHLANARLSQVVSKPFASEAFLRSVAEQAPGGAVRADAKLALATKLARAGHRAEAEAICQGVLQNTNLRKQQVVAKDVLFEIQRLFVGKEVPELTGFDLDDKPIKLSEFRGKAIMLAFWETGSLPCMAMIPHQRELCERYLRRPFSLVGVCAPDVENGIKETVKEQGDAWRSFRDYLPEEKRQISRCWHVDEWPTVFLIGHDGVIREVFRGNPGSRLDTLIEQLVTEAETFSSDTVKKQPSRTAALQSRRS
jgi:hypothetical protein